MVNLSKWYGDKAEKAANLKGRAMAPRDYLEPLYTKLLDITAGLGRLYWAGAGAEAMAAIGAMTPPPPQISPKIVLNLGDPEQPYKDRRAQPQQWHLEMKKSNKSGKKAG